MKSKVVMRIMLALLFINMLTLASARASYSGPTVDQSPDVAFIDLYTQKEPCCGKGPNRPSDAFAPQEEVILYANVTNDGKPEQDKIVAFQINGPTNPIENETFVRTAMTDASGLANISFTIPWPNENAEIIIFGIWSAVAWVEIEKETVKDTLTFRVGWIVEIVSIWTINENLQPQTRFARGTCVGVEMVLRNIAMKTKMATFTLVVYDCESHPIANTTLEDVGLEPGETSIYVLCELEIPKWAFFGYAMVYANAYTAPPHLGGTSYCPEASAGFRITLGDVAVVSVTPSLTKVYAGGVVNVTVTVRNEGRETETFNVTAYADEDVAVIGDEVIIRIQTVTELAPSNQTTLTFTWNTTGVTPGNYTISAQASIVPAETDTDDNTYTDGWVVVRIVGDVDGDRDVDWVDLGLLGLAYGSRPGDDNWNPNADFDDDGEVTWIDLGLLGLNYGVSCS